MIHRTAERISIAAVVLMTALVLMTGCAGLIRDRAMLVTEEGITAADNAWGDHYNAKLAECKALHDPGTPGALECFGPTHAADAVVSAVVVGSIEILREYWRARAAGVKPDYTTALKRVALLMAKLPAEAIPYFARVRGA